MRLNPGPTLFEVESGGVNVDIPAAPGLPQEGELRCRPSTLIMPLSCSRLHTPFRQNSVVEHCGLTFAGAYWPCALCDLAASSLRPAHCCVACGFVVTSGILNLVLPLALCGYGWVAGKPLTFAGFAPVIEVTNSQCNRACVVDGCLRASRHGG